ncbi:MAG: hypothetical protein HOV94_34785 [Saccharothrix sp.]|nr:hypothetical protein [Saccharothrix sp.]
MRELIYLSTAKLRQFLPAGATRRLPRVSEVEAQIPLNLGGVRFSFPAEAAAGLSHLNDVVRYLVEQSDQQLRWYTEAGLEPGRWVQFEARMNYQVLEPDDASRAGTLVFWDVSATNPVRLLLHGSPRHLMAAAADDRASYHTSSAPQGFLSSLGAALAESTRDRSLSLDAVTSLIDGVNVLPADTASMVTGLARVTGTVGPDDRSRIVIASPLYVEYSR